MALSWELRSNRACHMIPKLRALLDIARVRNIPIFY
jgi:hypothetical protein